MHHWVSLLSQPYRKCLDFSDLLPALLTVWGCAVTPPPSTRPPTRLLKVINLRRMPNADSAKNPTQWKLLLRSWLAGAYDTPAFPLTREENKPVEPQQSAFPTLRECEQTQHCCYSDPNAKHCQSGQSHRYLFILFYFFFTPSRIHASDCLQGPFIKLQPEQTGVQIRHNNLPMLFMWLTEPAQSIHAGSYTLAHTQKCLRCQSKMGLLKHTINRLLPAIWWRVQGYLC